MLDIFNSKSRDWVTLTCQLEDHVVKACREKRTAYFEGVLYRLSSSGHLIRFFVPQESFQVQAIELPKFVTPKEIINRLDKEQKVLLSNNRKEDLINYTRTNRCFKSFMWGKSFLF